jgi:flagellar motor switch protein FliG
MKPLSPSLRKAAVLISALDEATADALLAQMGPDEAAKVRRALVELNDIPGEEQQQVLADFFQRQGLSRPEYNNRSDDVSLELSSAGEQIEATTTADDSDKTSAVAESHLASASPFDFLQQIAPQSLAAVLSREHPQTVTVIIAHLPPEQAADLLEQLPTSLATSALERMASLHELAPEVMSDLARALRDQLTPLFNKPGVKPPSLDRLGAVLEAMDYRQRERVLLQLSERNAALLGHLGLSGAASTTFKPKPKIAAFRYRLASDVATIKWADQLGSSHGHVERTVLVTFEDFPSLDNSSLKTIFAAADPQIVLLALTAADAALVTRILSQLPAAEAAVVQQRLEHPGPIRLREIEQARQELAAIASRLAREESIPLPVSARFAAAI